MYAGLWLHLLKKYASHVIGTNREDEMGIQEKTKFKSRLQQEHDL
jgi:hypothetical protein